MKYHGIFGIVLIFALTPLASGQTFELLHSFDGSDGAQPVAELLQGKDGAIYGTTSTEGGEFSGGTVFKLSNDGLLETLSRFTVSYSNGFAEGVLPESALVQDEEGNLYGTTTLGGAYSTQFGGGNVFKINTNGVRTNLYSFSSSMRGPFGGVTLGRDGFLYGTTQLSGTGGDGTVFKMTTAGALVGVFEFNEAAFGNGEYPEGKLIQADDGDFYGTTTYGGGPFAGSGTIFRITTNLTLTKLKALGYFDGSYPRAGLIQGTGGNFYGTTSAGGGALKDGTVFRIASSGMLTPLKIFSSTNGSDLRCRLLQTSQGDLYGTTYSGGASNMGTVFKLTSNGFLKNIVAFTNGNGRNPWAGLIQGNDGNLYGTTYQGGANGKGTIFRIVMPVSLNSRVNGHELVLSWPTNALGFTLQSAADFNSPTSWIDFTNAPAVVGAQFTITNNISASAQFYRLKKP